MSSLRKKSTYNEEKRLETFSQLKLHFRHACTLKFEDCDVASTDSIQLPENSTCMQRFCFWLRKIFVISLKHPKSYDYFRSEDSIQRSRNDLFRRKLKLIHPFSEFRLFYEMYFAVVLLFAFVYTPLVAAFHNEEDNYLIKYLSGLFVLDILLTFFTGYVIDDDKIVVMSRRMIFRYYIFRSTFIFDAIACITPDFITDKENILYRVFHLFGMLRIVRVRHCYCCISRTLKFFKLNHGIFRFIKHTCFGTLLIHWWACIIYLTPQIRYFITKSLDEQRSEWLYNMDVPFDAYIRSFYYASGFLLCIRTQDWRIRPWEEYMIGILARSFGKIFILFTTVLIVPKILTINALETKYYEIKEQLHGFMFKKQLPRNLRNKLISNYEYKYRGHFFQENKITYILSDQLRRDINSEVLSKLAQNVTLFRMLPNKSLEAILSHLKLQIYLPADLIIRSGATGDCMYFLASGTVSVLTPSGQEICHLNDGDFFGEVCLIFKDKKRTASVLAVETCEVYKLSKRGFRSSLRMHSEAMALLKEVAIRRMETADLMESDYLRAQNELTRLIK